MLSCLCIYICPFFPSIVVHYLPLSSILSVHFKYLYFSRKKIYFLSFKQIPFFLQFFLVSPQISSLIFSSQYYSFFIGFFQIVHQFIYCNCHLFLFSSVFSCISFNLFSYVRSFNSGTILVAILCFLSNFNRCFFL